MIELSAPSPDSTDNGPIRLPVDERRYGKLLVLGRGPDAPGRQKQYRVRCDCGIEKLMRAERIGGGNRARSCGCMRGHTRIVARSAKTATFTRCLATTEQMLTADRLRGRVCIQLTEHGPMRAPELAARCTRDATCVVRVEDLAAIAASLWPYVGAILDDAGVHVIFLHRHSRSAVVEVRDRIAETEPRRCAA